MVKKNNSIKKQSKLLVKDSVMVTGGKYNGKFGYIEKIDYLTGCADVDFGFWSWDGAHKTIPIRFLERKENPTIKLWSPAGARLLANAIVLGLEERQRKKEINQKFELDRLKIELEAEKSKQKK